MVRNIFFSLITFLSFACLHAQTIQIGSVADESARSFQLMGKTDPSVSFTIRPLTRTGLVSNRNIYSYIDSQQAYQKPVIFANKKGQFTLLPVTLTQQFNSHHPYGWNDGSMIAARGYQSLVSGGVYAAIGPLEIQLQPEMVYAAGSAYENNFYYGSPLANVSYNKIQAGQSSIRLSAGAVSVGVSTENLWWGPGINSSLLMSNNAPGFGHIFFSPVLEL